MKIVARVLILMTVFSLFSCGKANARLSSEQMIGEHKVVICMGGNTFTETLLYSSPTAFSLACTDENTPLYGLKESVSKETYESEFGGIKFAQNGLTNPMSLLRNTFLWMEQNDVFKAATRRKENKDSEEWVASDHGIEMKFRLNEDKRIDSIVVTKDDLSITIR